MSLTILQRRNWANKRVKAYDLARAKVPAAAFLQQFESRTSPGILYTVKSIGNLQGNTYYECDCPGFQYKRGCRHIDEVK